MSYDPLSSIRNALVECNMDEAISLVQRALDSGASALSVLNEALIPAIRKVGDLWEEGEYFLPELLVGAEIMQKCMELLNPLLLATSSAPRKLGKVVIGTVEGDIHDIGKNLVASMLRASNFDVLDLGSDVPISKFVQAAKQEHANLICLSALLTTTMIRQRDVVELLKSEGLRESVKVMVGGAPVNETWVQEIGADGWAEDAVKAVKIAQKLLEKENSLSWSSFP
jgi:corrinoid protein of di/trimethylamine methyltransferase